MSDLRLPMDNEGFRADMQQFVEIVMEGLVFPGVRVETIIDTVVALRENPELAAKLLT